MKAGKKWADREKGHIERHPLNPQAYRTHGGVWNEATLGITDWETPLRRVVLPGHLLDFLDESFPPVLRWDAEKYDKVIREHGRDLQVITDITLHLDHWRFVGKERKSDNYRVLFQDKTGRWYAATFGELQGSFNIITVFSGSADRFMRNRRNGMERVVERSEET